MFPLTSSRETLRLSGKQNSLFPSGAHIKSIQYHRIVISLKIGRKNADIHALNYKNTIMNLV